MRKHLPLVIALIPIILLIFMIGIMNMPTMNVIGIPLLFLFIFISAPFTQVLVLLNLTDSKQFPTPAGFVLVAVIYSALLYFLARRTQAAFPKPTRRRRK